MSPLDVGSRWLPLTATAVGLLLWSNAVVPRLPTGDGTRALANLGATVVLVLVARASGLTSAELGLARGSWPAGARWGGVALAAVTAGYGVMLAVPALRVVLADARPEELPTGQLLLRALVLIPLGTVLCEEVAFRGVLLAAASRVLPARGALAVTSLVFGLWHVSSARWPTSPGVSPVLPSASVAATVIVTGAGGLVLGWLRQRSGSLLAPVGLHLGTNSVGLVAAAVAAARSHPGLP